MAWAIVVPHHEATRAGPLIHDRPHPALVGRVLTYTATDHVHPEPVSWTIAPLGAVTLSIALHGAGGHPVMGLRDGPIRMRTDAGRSCALTVGLSPEGAHALFGLPLAELANTAVGLADLVGRQADDLVEQVALTPDWPGRFRVVDRFLLGRTARGALSRQVAGAWRRLTSTAGGVRVDALADEVGWTRQHLRTRFREQIGLTPKTVARQARLGRAAALMARPDPLPLAEIAALCGYADQSHLNRDFRDLTGLRPTDYAPR